MITIKDLDRIEKNEEGYYRVWGFNISGCTSGYKERIKLSNISYPFILGDTNIVYSPYKFIADGFIFCGDKLTPIYANLNDEDDLSEEVEDKESFLEYSPIHSYFYLPKIHYSLSGIVYDEYYEKINCYLGRVEKIINDFYLTEEEIKAAVVYVKQKFYKIQE